MRTDLRVDLYQNRLSGKWRWRFWAGSRKVGGATQSYHNEAECIDNLELVLGGRLALADSEFPWAFLRRPGPDWELANDIRDGEYVVARSVEVISVRRMGVASARRSRKRS